MLVGAYPFEDPGEPKNFRKTLTVSRPKFHPANVDMDTTFTFDLRLALIMPLNFLSADSQRTICNSRLCPGFNGVQTSAVPDLRGKTGASNASRHFFNVAKKKTLHSHQPFGAADNHSGDQEPPLVPEEPAHRDDRRVSDEHADD
jgi:hypothetical protein